MAGGVLQAAANAKTGRAKPAGPGGRLECGPGPLGVLVLARVCSSVTGCHRASADPRHSRKTAGALIFRNLLAAFAQPNAPINCQKPLVGIAGSIGRARPSSRYRRYRLPTDLFQSRSTHARHPVRIGCLHPEAHAVAAVKHRRSGSRHRPAQTSPRIVPHGWTANHV